MAHANPLVLTPEHPDFPIAVRAMGKPPSRIFLNGALPQGRKLAIVGTRRASAPALRFAHDLAERLCEAGWSVWSGGAAGIDSAAHEGALHAGGKTVVVMGTGFDHLYPASNAPLFRQVLDAGGAWLSPYPPEQVGTRWSFLARNELLASLVDHVVVVQAPARSGARSTMAAGRRMGKTTWAVPASPWDRAAEGCLLEIAAGARVLCYPEQILGLPRPRSRAGLPNLSSQERAVVEAVMHCPAHLDTICDQTGLSAAQASAAALTLTLKRVLLESADGLYHLDSCHEMKETANPR
jgi:DNA processing protein